MKQVLLGGKTIDETCMDIFNQVFNGNHRSIPFDPRWSNGSGSFDFAVYGEHAPRLETGGIYKSQANTGRRLMFIGTKVGNVVIYEGRASNELPMGFFFQATQAFHDGGWFFDQQLDDYDLELMLGTRSKPNIGQRINSFMIAVKKTTERTAALV